VAATTTNSDARAPADFVRALAFEDAIREAACDRVERSERATAFLTPSLPRVYDLSFLRVDEPAGATASELAAQADATFRSAGMLGFRRVQIAHSAAGERLAPEFRRLGWDVARHVFMALRRPLDRPAAGDVLEVQMADIAESEREYLSSEPWARDEGVVDEIVEKDVRYDRAAGVRYFAGLVDRRPVAWAKLYSSETTGQVEDVATLAGYRRLGLGRATVTAALQASVQAGHDFTFIVADADDWVAEGLYRKLGFDELDVVYLFTRR
jgi:ribosomal protein S18 acetylase RimI-like enzyme